VTRAIWKGELAIGDQQVPVRMYSAVEDRKVHFRLLHAKDESPVEQRIVRKTDGKEVGADDRRKALPVSDENAVILQPEELEALEPPPSREVRLCRFVKASLLSDQWYDRPYWLGPDDDDAAYFALAEAVERARVLGIARWVMRKKPYLGALTAADGHLMMITLRRADQVLSVADLEIPESREPDEKELVLAERLVDSIADDFEPARWHDEYRERVSRLVEAKARGEKIRTRAPKRKPSGGDLAESLRRSLAAVKEKKVA
jgi:DNA end-binding protein Ku